jgi:NADPH:quinone reductase-like Zn-dependent oxidoreductase/2',3'-cyclic-nucleotide 2'-phosphodiesterase (5'-nucleotidase family)
VTNPPADANRAPRGAPAPRAPTLRIVAINDVYSLENLPRLRTLVEHHRATDPADVFLVTLAGDFVAPSLLSSLDAGRGMVECMKMVGVTHAIFGNHEDDIPTEALRKRVAELGATWLSTNLTFDPPLPRSQVLAVGRVRVGLVGVVMTDPATYHRSPFGGGAMTPANDAAREEAKRLVSAEGCACVIPLTHQTLAEDRDLARAQREPPFPVIIGGHEHVVDLEELEGTWLVKAGSDALHAAVIDLSFSAEAPPPGRTDAPSVRVRIDDVAGYAEDSALRALVDARMSAARELEAATLMTISPGQRLSSVGARARQTTIGTLICSAVRGALRADGCIINGGGIRGGRDYTARITYGDLKQELPFDNEVVVVSLRGQVLKDAILASRAQAPAESGSFLQVDDRIVVDASNELVAVGGIPVGVERTYEIALVRELLLGLDHIEPLARWAHENPSLIPPAGSGRETKLIVVDAFSVALWRQMGGFDEVDTDHDGMVTEAEIFAAVARVTAEPGSHLTAGFVLRALDTNHDLTISRAEAGHALPPGRRVVLESFGETPLEAIADHMSLEDMVAPDPKMLGTRDVIVSVKSASVGWVDLLMTSGQYQHVPKPPYCPGLEYAGVVAWVGDEVDEVKVGDSVLVDGLLAGPRSLGAYQGYGGFASYGVAPVEAVRRIPGTLTFDQAANLLGNYETAYHCLVTRGNVRPGETVLIHGASGSTGLAAVHVAKLLGAKVIATGRSDAKLAVVKEQGADHVVSCKAATGEPGVRKFRDDVKALTGGEGVDVVYDGVGGDISLESLRCVKFGARFLIVGWAATPFVAKGRGERGAPNANVLPTNLIMMKGLDVLGCPTVISTVMNPAIRAPRLAQVWSWAESGKIRPHVSHTFPLTSFKEAMRAKWSGDVIGGCVLHP